jgi:ABC-2 type transport system ATP-binding protein
MTAANGSGSTPAIELCDLHRHFGRLHAVDGVSFKAYPGQVMGFIGPNGAGKTTAMRILATLDVPTSGEAFINGYSVVDDPDKVRRIVGYMPDSFGKYANMDVVEYVDFFARAYGLSGGTPARRRRARPGFHRAAEAGDQTDQDPLQRDVATAGAGANA